MRVLSEYVLALGWGLVGAITMGVSLGLLLKIFTWLTPVDEWAELKSGNVGIAIVMGAVIVAFGLVISAAIHAPALGR
ncbi:MAG: DUF350 domain-containing protein [Candidatus Rokubacteria bacterium]|nr:DUF350 domain-containing protein [Candidatus Rokubacteria bacterium]